MKSKGLFGKKYLDIQEREVEIGSPDEDHVIVKVHACGICGTDINFVRDWEDEAMALGHGGVRSPLGPGNVLLRASRRPVPGSRRGGTLLRIGRDRPSADPGKTPR